VVLLLLIDGLNRLVICVNNFIYICIADSFEVEVGLVQPLTTLP